MPTQPQSSSSKGQQGSKSCRAISHRRRAKQPLASPKLGLLESSETLTKQSRLTSAAKPFIAKASILATYCE